MRNNNCQPIFKTWITAGALLLTAASASFGQQTINLSAGPTTTTLPDGTTVPMWGYTCGAAVATNPTPVAACAGLNPNAAGAWSPVIITVPTGQPLTISLTNNLSFLPTGGTTPNYIPTSIMIVGQIGGGLGSTSTAMPSPAHNPQSTTWPIANVPSVTNYPPPQGPRVQSFSTEVAAVGETSKPAGEVGTQCASPCSLTWNNLQPGTYLLESGTHPSIQVPMGLYGLLVVTTAPAGSTAGTAYPGVTYNSEIAMEFSELDAVQNGRVNTAVSTAGFSETMVWSGQVNGCGNASSPTYNQCYPPAVNYSPLYYLINGVAFNKTNASASLFNASALTGVAVGGTGTVLVRLVNAGLRMHVPAIVGAQTSSGLTAAAQSALSMTSPIQNGFSIIAQDGNLAPGVVPQGSQTAAPDPPKVETQVFMAAGKTFDVMINAPAAGAAALPIYDRQLSLSANAIARDAGMLAYININGNALPSSGALGAAVARSDTYNSLVSGQPLTVSDISKGVIANDTNVFGVRLVSGPTSGTLSCSIPGSTTPLCPNGTFTYTPTGAGTSDAFTYCANGAAAGTVNLCATVTLGAATIEGAGGITLGNALFQANTASYVGIKPPGVLAYGKDAAGYPLSVVASTVVAAPGLTVVMDPGGSGGFNASLATPCATAGGCTATFTYQAKNSQGTLSASAAMVTIKFPAASNLAVTVKDPQGNVLNDYRWIIEEDKTFYVNPNCTTTSSAPITGCPSFGLNGQFVPATFGVNFHTSHMEYVAQGCTNSISCESGQTLLGVAAACDLGNGNCRTGVSQKTPVLPSAASLDPGCGFPTSPCISGHAPFPKRYYISVLPGDGANPFNGLGGGHTMGGAPISWNAATNSWNPVTVIVEPTPLPPGKLSVMVFEDDFPLNGEQDSGGGIDVIASNEPGLGGFNVILWDDMGASGDVTGQMTYDMFNMPLSNSLAGTVDPATGLDACPIAQQGTVNPAQGGITGMIVTCPKYESDGMTLSPLAGQAVVANLMPGRFSVQAIPGADRIARGEEWLQTNTLDGQHPHDSFIRVGEPSFFQEYGPAGYHVAIGFANPKIINARHTGVCSGTDLNLTAPNCTNTVKGRITAERMSRIPDERLYSSGSRDQYSWTQCFVSLGDPDGEDFMFTKCDANGNFTFTQVPSGSWRLSIFDQWNDQLMDGLATPVNVANGNSATINMGDVPVQQWQANVYTRTFIDDNKDGVYQSNELGIPLLNTTVRYRDGALGNNLLTDFGGVANFNETFPLFNWYVVEADTTRYKTTGIHTVYDAGGPPDGASYCGTNGYPKCGAAGTPYEHMANTVDPYPLPSNLSVPGAIYCTTAACTGQSISTGVAVPSSPNASTGRIDPPWVAAEGWQGFSGQSNYIEFAKTPYAPTENGGIKGHVIYASTRPFDDPQWLVQTQWEPLVPHVTMNLYQEGFATDGVTPTLTLVDSTQTSSFDDWAQGFRSDGQPNMNCPGQGTASGGANPDLFFYTLYNQPNYLNLYNSYFNGGTLNSLPNNSQFKCYDGMHNWNQLQPAPYDGMYSFPSVLGINPQTGKLNTAIQGGVGQGSSFTAAPMKGTNCTICVANPDISDPWRVGTPMLPAGKYVVEVVLPPGYELVKEEDKNILIGDNFIAPTNPQFVTLGNIFIMPDQASVATAGLSGPGYNPYNAQNPTQNLGASPVNWIVPGFLEPIWPCVGEQHTVPDYISLFPNSHEVAPFAGATRRLCDRKEVTLGNQMGATAKFFIYTSTHIAAKFTGGITDDFTSEFDPFAPVFGEKFAPPNMPVSLKDWAGIETNRVYSDHWGAFNGMTYSTWEVNPPNPTGYSPTMMVVCMNDKGPIPGPNGTMITDPLFNPLYSQFCYELPFMPGTTDYLDTPVVPTAAFVGAGYNNPDCNYPTLTPAVSSVTGDVAGPWVSAAGHNITITSLGDQSVNNYGYSGPAAATAPFNQKTVTRHYGFGGTAGKVTVGGQSANVVSWTDTTIVATVPNSVPICPFQQQAQYGGPNGSTVPTALCGQLVITASNGLQSIDTVNITVGGKQPTVLPTAACTTIQCAIDGAAPGDMIIIPPGTYHEMLLMWKPIRLQGVAAASTIIDANAHPAGLLLQPWRRSVNCLFGLSMNGQPISAGNPYDNPGDKSNNGGPFTCPAPNASGTAGTGPNGNVWAYFAGGPNYPTMVVDRIPLEGILGWDATVNGNLAEQLQEPSIMGAYEGAGITVVAKGVNIPANSTDVFGSGAEATFPVGTTLLTGPVGKTGGATLGDQNSLCRTSSTVTTNPYPSNFMCNPSRIDGIGVTDSSQGGGGMFIHAWAHNLEIANNRVVNNTGSLTGGITLGQGEFPEAYLNGNLTGADPNTCLAAAAQSSLPVNYQLPYCENINLNVHNNMIAHNSSTGDELFSATPAGAGGVSICTGDDWYNFNYNWVCGNLSTGDAGGVGHMGFSWNGDIAHNSILFNQSTNPSIQSNGGGLMIMGAAPDATVGGVECGSVTDNDCVPGLSDGAGPGLVINANLIQGNSADNGSGGGLRLQAVNGTDVSRYPNNPANWYHVSITNNIIVNNVAGWDGAGISLEDSLAASIINNTIADNDTTASSGVLFNTLGAPLASSQSPAPLCQAQNGGAVSCPQPAGLVTMQNSPQMTSSFTTGTITCPPGNFQPGTGASNGSCINISYPALYNNIFWGNRAFQVGVGALGTTTQNQQNVVTLYNANFTGGVGSAATSQAYTGACPAGSSYWDIGVRNDTGPASHASGFKLNPLNGVLSSLTGAYSATNLTNNPLLVSQYCNGSRVPPENGGLGYQVPPGISDAVIPNPVFTLTPTATVDEGNNWINLSWGPLSILNPVFSNSTTNVLMGNYSLQTTSPDIDAINCNPGSNVNNGCIEAINSSGVTTIIAPQTDFFGNSRPDPGKPTGIDIGAIELSGVKSNGGALVVTPTSLTFFEEVGVASPPQTLTLTNSGGSSVNGIAATATAPYSISASTCGNTLGAGSSCTFSVVFTPIAGGTVNGTVAITASVPVTNSPVGLIGTGFTVAPASLAFGNIQTLQESTPQTVTVANPINATANLSISTIGFGGTNPLQFLRTATGATDCGTTYPVILKPGTSCTIGVAFDPDSSGAKSALLNIGPNASPVGSVPLSGTGVPPSFSLTPASLAFGNQSDHTTSASKPATLTNTGLGPLTLNSITIGGTNPALFPQTNNCGTLPVVIPQGGSCTINVSFAPGVAAGSDASAGSKSATLGAAATGATSPTPVALSGTTLAATVAFTLPTLTSSPANITTKAGLLTVRNTGTSTNPGPLVLTAAPTINPLTGTGTFSIIAGGTCALNTPIPAGSNCTYNVQYAPNGSTANSTATVTITDTGAVLTSQTTGTITGN
jgi:hypothetical protein